MEKRPDCTEKAAFVKIGLSERLETYLSHDLTADQAERSCAETRRELDEHLQRFPLVDALFNSTVTQYNY